MEFVIAKADFQRELGLSQRIVEKKNTIPILSNLLLEVDSGGLTITATDLEVGLLNHCAVEVVEPGSVTVSAKKLYEIVRSLSADEVRVASNDKQGVTIACGRTEFKLVGLEPKDFPNLPGCDFASGWEADASLFSAMVNKVLFAVTHEESRFPLSGVLLLGASDGMSMVATDGHRLAISETKTKIAGVTPQTRLLIPRKALLEVKQIAELGDAPLTCEVKENHIYFRIGERSLMARMIEEKFPAYEKVIPEANDKTVIVAASELDGAVRRAALLSSEKARVVRFKFAPGVLTVSSSNPELGEVHEEIPIDFSSEEFEIAFNAQYLTDFFAAVESQQVRLELKDSSTQALLRPDREEDRGDGRVDHFYVVMPLRL